MIFNNPSKISLKYSIILIGLIFNNLLFPINLISSENYQIENKFKIENDTYLLGPGDRIEITFFYNSEYNDIFYILRDGIVVFPLIGAVNLNNLSINQAVKLVESKFSEQLIRPELNIKLLIPRQIKVSIIGEVKRPGLYTMVDKDGRNVDRKSFYSPTIIDAIQTAGGITQNAGLREVVISRRLAEGKYKKTSVNLIDLFFNGNHTQNIKLSDGHIIRVNSVKKISSEVMQVAEANLSPKTITIHVVGKVESPQKMEVPFNTSLNQAILMAGGTKSWKANTRDVQLLRTTRNGGFIKKKFKINFSENISEERNPLLSNNDIIKVGNSLLNNIGEGISTFTKPVSGLANTFLIFKLIEE